MTDPQPPLGTAEIRAQLDALDGHDWATAAAAWTDPLLDEVERLEAEIDRECETADGYLDRVRREFGWSSATAARLLRDTEAERDALAAEIDADTHEYHPMAGRACSATVYGTVVCGLQEDHPRHRTSSRVLADVGRDQAVRYTVTRSAP